MFAGIGSQIGAAHPPTIDGPRKIPPPTPVRFPQCFPKADIAHLPADSIVNLIQGVQRPADIKSSIFEAIGIHVIPNATAEEIIPDANYLPAVQEWNTISQDEIPEIDESTRQPLNNGNLSPGIQTYMERRRELLIDNTAAFRTIRRIPAPVGETAARLGNAYEFYKNLEFSSGYWPDTSLPHKPETSCESKDVDESKEREQNKDDIPIHLQTHLRTGTGSQLSPETRQNLLTAFVKLVAYDFGCNVSHPRTEPRLHLTPKDENKPPSYFNSSVMFVYRTPTERAMARAGIVEGPVAALSARAGTVFGTETEAWLDFAREVVAVLLTAQQRAREDKVEKRFGEGKWWTSVPRWGGGVGGPVGKEGDRLDELSAARSSPGAEAPGAKIANEVKRQIGGINGPSPNKRSKKVREMGNLPIYEKYREMKPPGPTWDRKAKYMSIGRVQGAGYDDIFLVSALNHHICIVRTRVPRNLLEVFDGGDTEWEKVCMWRSKWFDMYIGKERVEAMELLWGMMAWMMRKIEGTNESSKGERHGDDTEKPEKMDLS